MAVINVAVAVIIDAQDQVLISRRNAQQHQGDRWEFPGGKVEPGETSREALRREILEELGIEIQGAEFVMDVIHHYNEKSVVLNVFEVRTWSGNAAGQEGQPLKWVSRGDLARHQFPDANREILNRFSMET